MIAAIAVAGLFAVVVSQIHDEDPPKREVASERGSTGVVTTGKASTERVVLDRQEPKGTLRLEGQVIDEQQHPVAGATVVLQGTPPVTTASAADGSFAFAGLVARRYRVSAHDGDDFAAPASVRLSATSEPVTLRMHRGATLVVHVRDDRGPVSSASVMLDRDSHVTTDASGDARLRGLSPRFHYVEVSAEGRAPAAVSVTPTDEPGGTMERTVVLRRGAVLAGVVRGPDGSAVADAQVTIDGGPDRWLGTAKADAAGAWQFDAIGAGKYALRATSEIYGPAADMALELDGVTPRRDVVVRVDFDAQLVGTVVDAHDQPVPDAAVSVASFPDASLSKRTDAAGRFQMLGFKAGTYDVFAAKGLQASVSVPTTIANGQRLDVRLVLQDAGIAGTVVDTKGAPVPDARVSALGGARMASSDDVTDSHGHFELTGLPPGAYRVSATWPDQDSRRRGTGDEIKTGTTDAKLVLAALASVTGRVTLDGAPLPSYGVLLSEHPELSFIGTPTRVHALDGRFTLKSVSPGTWGIVVMGPGTGRKTVADIHVEEGRATDVGDIAMAHGQRISGHVHDANGAPVAAAKVAIGLAMPGLDDGDALQGAFRGSYQTTTDASGAYAFDGIAPIARARRAQIAATHPTSGTSPAAAIPDGDATIDLVLAATGGIDGTVVGFTGSFGMVSARRTGDATDPTMTRIEPTGEFHIDNLVPGDYMLTRPPLPGALGPAPVKVTVAANQRATVKLAPAKETVTLVVTVAGSCDGVMLSAGSVDPSPEVASGYQRCSNHAATFTGVEPGAYQACAGPKRCAPVTVTASPATQTVEIKAEP